jgi:hypothetical protein
MKENAGNHGRSNGGPRRTALSVLVVIYTLGLAGISSVLMLEASRKSWRDRWSNWTHPRKLQPGKAAPKPVSEAAGPEAHQPAARYRETASANKPPLRLAREHRSRRSPTRPTNRVSRTARPRAATRRLAKRTGSPRRARVARRSSGEQRTVWMFVVPRRAPLVTWAHPPDPTLPPHCRPRDPVVVGHF